MWAVVLLARAFSPKAELFEPVVLSFKASRPTPVFPAPVVLESNV